MIPYQKLYDVVNKTERTDAIRRVSDGAIVPFDLLNNDYQVYKRWIDEGNSPMPMPTLVDATVSTVVGTTNVSAKVG